MGQILTGAVPFQMENLLLEANFSNFSNQIQIISLKCS